MARKGAISREEFVVLVADAQRRTSSRPEELFSEVEDLVQRVKVYDASIRIEAEASKKAERLAIRYGDVEGPPETWPEAEKRVLREDDTQVLPKVTDNGGVEKVREDVGLSIFDQEPPF